MGPVDPSNQNSNGVKFRPEPKHSAKFQVNLNADGTFKDFKTDVTEPRYLNVMRAWASLFQIKKSSENSYVSKGEVSFIIPTIWPENLTILFFSIFFFIFFPFFWDKKMKKKIEFF